MANRRVKPGHGRGTSRNSRQVRNPRKGSTPQSRKARRAGFGARLKQAHHRAQDQVNRRGNGRQARMTRQAAIAGSAEIIEDDFGAQSLFQRVFHWLLAFAIMPFCFVTVVTLFQKAGEAKTLGAFWKSSEFVYLITGVGLMIGWFLVGVVNNLFLYLYVLGHEMTHAFFVYCCFGRVSDMKVSLDGGYIMTNKSNILIALSPYFVPFWSAVAITIEVILSFFWDIPYLDSVLIGVIGATWCFHIIWTVWMIPKDQPDLREHGTFFSLMVIIFANLILLSMMLCATSKELKLADFAFNWWNNVLDLSEAFMGLLTRLL